MDEYTACSVFDEWLREKGYIFKHSCEPTQKSMDLKLFEVVERTIQRSGHAPKVTRTTRVTGKGQSRIKKDRRCKGK
ncbi:phage antirepressor KilAC domain-containing protein [Trueperella sp. zg.1013]|uniref:phage antirepressor KilAC domain-containing protein n=1 Tax=Bulleidia sp. zg-1013 TaxID=2832408 RepID=UPI001C6E3B0C|nr:phage antirepressor KilAC domain-containing protein [Trueperella sp. zg.1013]